MSNSKIQEAAYRLYGYFFTQYKEPNIDENTRISLFNTMYVIKHYFPNECENWENIEGPKHGLNMKGSTLNMSRIRLLENHNNFKAIESKFKYSTRKTTPWEPKK